MHPFVLGELVLGHVPGIGGMIDDLSRLPQATTASANEVLKFIVDRKLSGLGIGYVDAHLLASARAVPEGRLLTHDKRLRELAERLGVLFER